MFVIGAFGDWGGVWDILPVNVTGNVMFDYFFTLVLSFGVLSMMVRFPLDFDNYLSMINFGTSNIYNIT